MKRCPTCQRTYPDDAPGFCVNDGTRLVTDEAQPYDPQKTILASAPPPPAQYPEPFPPPPPQNNPPLAPPPPSPPLQQAAWPAAPPPPPPQQHAQNYVGGYPPQQGHPQAWPPPYAPQAGKSRLLSLVTLILGLLSAIALTLLFLIVGGVLEPYSNLILISFWGSAALGLIALLVGIAALLSKRQRSKWMAIIGICLSLPAIAFCIYALISRPEIVSGTFG